MKNIKYNYYSKQLFSSKYFLFNKSLILIFNPFVQAMKTTRKHSFFARPCGFFSKIIGQPLSLLLLILILMGFQSFQTAQAVQVPLGAINFSNPVNLNQQADWTLAEVVDGNIVTEKAVASGWGIFGSTNQSNYLQVNVDLPGLSEINLNPGQSIDYYTFSISLYYSWDVAHSASAFTLSSSNDGGVNFVQITDILSASTNNENSELTFDTAGNFTATQPPEDSPLEVHNVEFNIASDITHLRYNVGPYAGWTGITNGNVTISELAGIANAEVIPEPSTYALIAGLTCFAWVFTLRRKRLQA